jgi:hypothetical protein
MTKTKREREHNSQDQIDWTVKSNFDIGMIVLHHAMRHLLENTPDVNNHKAFEIMSSAWDGLYAEMLRNW